MISAGDFKNGVTVEIDGNIYQNLRIPARKNLEKVQHLLEQN